MNLSVQDKEFSDEENKDMNLFQRGTEFSDEIK